MSDPKYLKMLYETRKEQVSSSFVHLPETYNLIPFNKLIKDDEKAHLASLLGGVNAFAEKFSVVHYNKDFVIKGGGDSTNLMDTLQADTASISGILYSQEEDGKALGESDMSYLALFINNHEPTSLRFDVLFKNSKMRQEFIYEYLCLLVALKKFMQTYGDNFA